MEESKKRILDWNAGNPDKEPIDTEVEDTLIAYLDGTGTLEAVTRAHLHWKGYSTRGESGA